MAVAIQIEPWTIEELHRLPDDGNKYELVRGDLFVTPAPSPDHEAILQRLTRMLVPYVAAQGLGGVYHPRAVIRAEGSEVEPDLMVRRAAPPRTAWANWPIPSLVVEVMSPFTRRRDLEQKRDFYLDIGVAEYWVVDCEREEVCVFRSAAQPTIARDLLAWAPAGAREPLAIPLRAVFAD